MISLAVWLFTACGVILVGIGGFFMALRPALLPEDVRFMGSTHDSIVTAVPGLTRWLRRVFWVLGGYIASTGFLVGYLAIADVQSGGTPPLAALALAGISSIGWMTVVKFRIQSRFKWALLAVLVLWTTGLLLAAFAQGS